MRAPLNFGPDYKRDFDATYPELAAEFGTLYMEAMLAPLQRSDRPLTELLQGDMIHPNAEGVALIVERLGPKVLELAARLDPPTQ
jgi:acyl-CoA thioesterase-1